MLQSQVRSKPLSANFSSPPRLYRRILVGYDGSAASEAALRTGRELALISRAALLVAAIQCLPNSDSDDAFQIAATTALRRYQKNLYRLRIAGLNEGIRVETFVAFGEPAMYL
jgi:nucleotide-binding universal stress UspA family protein